MRNLKNNLFTNCCDAQRYYNRFLWYSIDNEGGSKKMGGHQKNRFKRAFWKYQQKSERVNRLLKKPVTIWDTSALWLVHYNQILIFKKTVIGYLGRRVGMFLKCNIIWYNQLCIFTFFGTFSSYKFLMFFLLKSLRGGNTAAKGFFVINYYIRDIRMNLTLGEKTKEEAWFSNIFSNTRIFFSAKTFVAGTPARWR